jgi:hypothetical protein
MSARRLRQSVGRIWIAVLAFVLPSYAWSALEWSPDWTAELNVPLEPIWGGLTVLVVSASLLLGASLSALLYVKRPPAAVHWPTAEQVMRRREGKR